jgi:polyisoprenoid-binding protein YceI
VRARRQRWVRWVVAVATGTLVLAVAGPFIYIHFIPGPPAAKLALPKFQSDSSASGANTSGSGPASTNLAGSWSVETGSMVGFRVQAEVIGQQRTLIGRTSKVSGSLTMSNTSVSSGSFTVKVVGLTSGASERKILDVNAYPAATFVLTSPIELGSIPPNGSVQQFAATGNLTMHGIARAVNVSISSERAGSTVYVLADLPVVFTRWDLAVPSGFLDGIQSPGTVEVLLHLRRDT